MSVTASVMSALAPTPWHSRRTTTAAKLSTNAMAVPAAANRKSRGTITRRRPTRSATSPTKGVTTTPGSV
jgi:hypothetical protein